MTDCWQEILNFAVKSANPEEKVYEAISKESCGDNLTVISAGKAACSMARGAYRALNGKIKTGYVLTKYGHGEALPKVFAVREAAHPVPDENSVKYSSEILELAQGLEKDDKLIFLISGGASSLFEKPLVPLEKLKEITDALLKSSADINEINTIRKRLSAVKGGKFAKAVKCGIDCYILSDVIGDRLDVIASGPCCEDRSTSAEAISILKKYNLDFGKEITDILQRKMPESISGVNSHIVGNIKTLCESAAKKASELGYNSKIITTCLSGEAGEQGKIIGKQAAEALKTAKEPLALIYGGETTVTVKGKGKGGRNQELALYAAKEIDGIKGVTIFSAGSDGTDGPTDAAGGVVNGETVKKLRALNLNIDFFLKNNDSYNCLKKAGGLIITGPTGTNVNDLTVSLINP